MAEVTASYFGTELLEVGLYRKWVNAEFERVMNEASWGPVGSLWGRLRPEAAGHMCGPRWGDRWVACGWVMYRMELHFPGGWWRVGASEVSLAWGLCESLCLCLTYHLSLKAALVCVFAELPHSGARLGRG